MPQLLCVGRSENSFTAPAPLLNLVCLRPGLQPAPRVRLDGLGTHVLPAPLTQFLAQHFIIHKLLHPLIPVLGALSEDPGLRLGEEPAVLGAWAGYPGHTDSRSLDDLEARLGIVEGGYLQRGQSNVQSGYGTWPQGSRNDLGVLRLLRQPQSLLHLRGGADDPK